MSNYQELIQRIFTQSRQSQVEALRKLIYLSVNEQDKFAQYVPQIAQQLPRTLTQIEDEQVKLLSLQLLSEMATNFTTRIPAECYSFPQLVALLSDQNPEVRKASHYLILIFIKKYQQIDAVIEGYLERIHESPEHWKVLQKIIHSFQSLLVIEPKCVTYGQNYSHLDDLIKLLLENRTHEHVLVQKASEQTVNSFVKNEYVPEVLPKLDKQIMKELVDYAQRLSIPLQPKRKSPRQEYQRQVDNDDMEEIKITHRKTSVLEQLIVKLDVESDWKIKSETIEAISNELATGNVEIPDDLVEKVLDLTYDYNFKTCITAMNVLLTVVTLYPTRIINKYRQIEDVVIEKVCDLKMAVRQLAQKILKVLFKNQSKQFMKKILAKLNTCSTVGKEEILIFLQEVLTNTIVTDLNLVLGQISGQLMNENTRIKIKAIDCLVKICLANQLQQCKFILSKKLNKVYYDMFLERLREKMGVDKPQTWDEKANIKKGLTWQAPERIAHSAEINDKQSMTKIQFGTKKHFNETEEDFTFTGLNNNSKHTQKQLASTAVNSYKTSNTFNSFNSFKGAQMQTPSIQKQMSDSTDKKSLYSFNSEQVKTKEQQKKIPMKPTPIKKKTVHEMSKQEPSLVILSKQYQDKNNDDSRAFGESEGQSQKYIQEKRQSLDNKPKMKINRNRDKSANKIKQEQEKQENKQVSSQPFSIKKSVTKKERTIDYKATQYITKDDLSPLDDPKDTFKFIMTNLPKDSDWNKQFQSIDFLRRILKNHLDFYPVLNQNMSGIMPEVLKLVQSLRSSVAKNAMICLAEMCQSLKKSMDPFLEPIFIKLFKKAQDANSFIVEEVRKCIGSLCTYCSSPKICAIVISNSNSKSIPIKVNAAYCIDKILEHKQYDCQVLKQNLKVVSLMSNFIVDGSSEVRNMVKQIFLQLLEYNNASQVEGLFKRNSSKDAWEKWKNIMDKEATLTRK